MHFGHFEKRKRKGLIFFIFFNNQMSESQNIDSTNTELNSTSRKELSLSGLDFKLMLLIFYMF